MQVIWKRLFALYTYLLSSHVNDFNSFNSFTYICLVVISVLLMSNIVIDGMVCHYTQLFF